MRVKKVLHISIRFVVLLAAFFSFSFTHTANSYAIIVMSLNIHFHHLFWSHNGYVIALFFQLVAFQAK